jgi:hypothetical protein
MGKPEIQYFDRDGTWVKPSGAVRVDIVLQAGGGGAVTGVGPVCVGRGPDGALTVHAIPADELPGLVEVLIGRGGSPGGRDGYALIITHLEAGAPRLDHMPGDGRNMELVTEEEDRQLIRCTATGWLAADDPSGDPCPCGRRHVTIRSWVSGSGEGGQR